MPFIVYSHLDSYEFIIFAVLNMDTLVEQKLPVTFSSRAVEELKALIASQEKTKDKYLRIGVKGGGCAGFSYILEFDEKQAADTIYQTDNFEFIVDKAQEIYLFDTKLDFKGGLDNRGFIFENPNASSTCGCGTSFSV